MLTPFTHGILVINLASEGHSINMLTFCMFLAMLLLLPLLTAAAPMDPNQDASTWSGHDSSQPLDATQHWPTQQVASSSSSNSHGSLLDHWRLAHGDAFSTTAHPPPTWAHDFPTSPINLEGVDFDILGSLTEDHSPYGSTHHPSESHHTVGAPPHRAPAWAYDFSSPPVNLEYVDFDILRSLSENLPQHVSSPHLSKTDHAVEALGPIDHAHTSQKVDDASVAANVPRTPPEPLFETTQSGTRVPASMLGAHRKLTLELTRARMGWPEPHTFDRLDHLPAFRGRRSNLILDRSSSVRDHIVDRLFGGKLQWVGPPPDAVPRQTIAARSPAKRYSRRLPLTVTADNGEKLGVFMTTHNVPVKKGGPLKGTIFDGKPFYGFWGLPEKTRDKVATMVYYGSGVLEKEHNEVVDAHLGPLLQEFERSARG